MASVKIVAEYAKSGRSSCKICGKIISVTNLRLGLSIRDPRGFESVKWHHLSCFSVPQTFTGVEKIKGFQSLNRVDQEALKKWETQSAASQPENSEDQRLEQDSSNKSKKRLIDSTLISNGIVAGEDEEIVARKRKSGHEEEEEILVSVSDIKMKYKDAVLPPEWKAFKTVIFRTAGDSLHDSCKIAAFDFDGCLAKTSLRRVGPDEWSLMHPTIPMKLQRLHKEGYKLVVFTNESNIDRWKNKRQLAIDSKIGRLENFMQLVGVPMQIFIACGLGNGKSKKPDDLFRKPNSGMWRMMEKNFNSHIKIDMEKSFYVGDAAGRKDDHSDADIKFAKAVGLRFFVPEEYFEASSDPGKDM
ncbi:phosphoesterase isoform X2 [Wolffia australiana]